MIVTKEFLNKLKDFGINSYESKLWIALLSRGVSTAGELSDIANVPRSRSYDVLESLERKGFIITKIGKPIKYIAVSPTEVIERVKTKVTEDAQKQEVLLESLKKSEVVDELGSLYAKGIDLVEPTELSGIVKGRTNIHNHVETMIKTASKNVMLVTTEEGLIRKADVIKSAIAKTKSKNLSVSIYAPLTKKNKHAQDILEHSVNLLNYKGSSRMCIVDDKSVLFMLVDDAKAHPTYDAAVWVSTPFFANTLKQSFLAMSKK